MNKRSYSKVMAMLLALAIYATPSLMAKGEQGEGALETFPILSEILDGVSDDIQGAEEYVDDTMIKEEEGEGVMDVKEKHDSMMEDEVDEGGFFSFFN